MIVSIEKRNEYWNHFITRWAIEHIGGGHGVTGPRLRKIHSEIMVDDDFWADVILRHGGLHNSPENLCKLYEADYNHCLGNFWGMLYQNLVEAELVG